MARLARAVLLCVLVAVVTGCTRTKVVTREVPVEIEVPIAVPVTDTSFVHLLGVLEQHLARKSSLDTLRASASASDILKAASIDLQHARLFTRTIRRWMARLQPPITDSAGNPIGP